MRIFIKDSQVRSSTLSLSDRFTCIGGDATTLEWLEAYSKGSVTPLLLLEGTAFDKRVLRALSTIPFGKTMSYRELAHSCGTPKGARAIGNACGRNPFPLLIPCHRVIRSDGTLGGFAGDLEIKRRLLAFEISHTSY